MGVRYVYHNQVLLGSMALDLFAVLFGGAVALLPIFASDILHVGPAGLGLLVAAPSVGALVSMLWATRRPPVHNAGRMLLVVVAGFGVATIVFALSTVMWLSLLTLAVAGMFDGVSMVIRNTTLRMLSPEHLRGRIAAVNWIFIGSSNEIGAFESGVAATIFGVVPVGAAGRAGDAGRRRRHGRAGPAAAHAGPRPEAASGRTPWLNPSLNPRLRPGCARRLNESIL